MPFSMKDELKECITINKFYHKKSLKNTGKYENKKEFINLFNLKSKKNNLEHQLYQCNYKNKTKGNLKLCYAQFSNFMENLHCIDDDISNEKYNKQKNRIENEIKELKMVLDDCKRI